MTVAWFKETPESLRALAEERAILDATEAVSAALHKRRVSRAELAKRVGIGRSEITQRLSGRRNLTVRTLAAMLDALGYDLRIELRDRTAAQPVWHQSSEIRPTSRYTTNGTKIELMRSAS